MFLLIQGKGGIKDNNGADSEEETNQPGQLLPDVQILQAKNFFQGLGKQFIHTISIAARVRYNLNENVQAW
jgi:hypothetical protein